MAGDRLSQPRVGKRYFTVETANRMLPLVRSIVEDIVAEQQRYQQLAERLMVLQGLRREALPEAHREEVEQLERETQRSAERLRELVHELHGLGVELKGPSGLVDFPALMEGREVYLCWQLGEPEVMYWHEKDAGFAGRQPLTAQSRCGGQEQ
jgi:hypothetical protein